MTTRTARAFAGLMLLGLGWSGVWGNSVYAEGVRIGIVREAGSDEIQAWGDLLEVGLSADPSFEVLDRSEVARIFAEHELQMAFEASGIEARRRLGELLRADLLVFLRPGVAGEKPAVFVGVADVRTGLRLARHVFSASAEPEAGVASCLETVRRALEKWREPPAQVVAVTPFLSQDLGHAYAHLSETYRWMAETILEQFPGYFVVEWAEARAYLAEVQLSPSRGELFQHALPWFITGEYRNEGSGERRNVAIQLQFDRDGAKTSVRLDVPAADVRERLGQVLREQMDPAAGPAAETATNAYREATHYWTRAHAFMDLGQYRTALSLFEAALLAVPRDLTLDFNGWGYSVDRQVQDFPVTPPDILYCKIIQAITLILRQGDPADDVALANTYLGDWMRSRITAHRASPRYFYELRDAAILHGAGAPEAFARSRAIYELYAWMDGDPGRREYAPKGFRDMALHYYELTPDWFQAPEDARSYADDLSRIYGFLLKHPRGKGKIWTSASRHLFDDRYPLAVREELVRQLANVMPTNEYRVFAALLPLAEILRDTSVSAPKATPLAREFADRLQPHLENLGAALRDLYGEDLVSRLRDRWNPPDRDDGLLQVCWDTLRKIPLPEGAAAPSAAEPPANTWAADPVVPGRAWPPPPAQGTDWADQMRLAPFDIVNNWGAKVTNAPVLELTRLPIQPLPPLRRTVQECGVSDWRKMPGGVDVVVQQGHVVQAMKIRGELLDLYDAWADAPGARVLDAVYDGQCYWIFQVDSGNREFKVVVLDRQGQPMGRLASPEGVPFCGQGRAEPLGEGQVLWAGHAVENRIAQTWLAVMTAAARGLEIDVFHEAKSQWSSVGRRALDPDEAGVAFAPDCLKAFWREGVPMAVVGSRYGRFLLLDCQRRKVVRTLPAFPAQPDSEYVGDDRQIVCFDHNVMRTLSLDTLTVESGVYRLRDDSLSPQKHGAGFLGTDVLFGQIDLFRPEGRVHFVYDLPGGAPLRFFRSNFYDLLLYRRAPDGLYAVSCAGTLTPQDSDVFVERPEWQKIFERMGGGQCRGAQ